MMEETPNTDSSNTSNTSGADTAAVEQETTQQIAEADKKQTEVIQDKSAIEALAKERDRILKQIKVKREEKRQIENDAMAQLRQENLEIARQKIASEYGYTDEASLNNLMEEFQKYDSGAITVDKIYADLKKAHFVLNADKYDALEKEWRKHSAAAGDMILNQASMATLGGGGVTTDVPLTQEDIEAARWAGMPLEEYKRLKFEGKI